MKKTRRMSPKQKNALRRGQVYYFISAARGQVTSQLNSNGDVVPEAEGCLLRAHAELSNALDAIKSENERRKANG